MVHAGENDRKNTITVNGNATVEIPTVYTEITLAVSVEEDTADRAHEEVAEKSEDLIKMLKREEPLKLETTGIQLHAVYSSSKISSSREIKGYRATNQVLVKVKTEQAGKVIDKSVKFGVNRISGLRFLPEESKLEEARQKALQLAALDAREQADTVLKALGLKRKSIQQIQVNHSSARPATHAFMTKEAARTPVEGGDHSVSAQVMLIIEY